MLPKYRGLYWQQDAVGTTHTQPDPPAPAPALSTAGTPAPPAPTEDPYDRDRAMRTIATLRDVEKQAKADKRELEELRRSKQEREEADLSEKDKAERRAAELKAERDSLKSLHRETVTKYEVQLAAQRLGFRDVEVASLLVTQRNALKYDDDGTPTNVDAVLKDILRDKPYLGPAEGDTAPQGQTRGLPGTPRPARTAQPADAVAQAEQSYRQGAGGVRYRPL